MGGLLQVLKRHDLPPHEAAKLLSTADGDDLSAPIVGALADSDPVRGWEGLTWTGSDIVLDADDLPIAIFVGTPGSLVITGSRGDATFLNVSGMLPVRPSVIKSSSTARDLVAVYEQ